MIYLDNQLIDDTKRFPDGTLALKIKTEGGHSSIIWNYEDDKEMSLLYYISKHLQTHGITVSLTLPYIPNARMDRIKSAEDIFTLKYFIEFINDLKFIRVYVLDPHSPVSYALLNNFQILDVDYYINMAIKEIPSNNLIVCYPDEGSMKRYKNSNTLPYCFGIKIRDWKTGNINSLQLINEEFIRNKNVVIIDDICSKGGTPYQTALALKKAGANDIYLYITHCEHNIFNGELIKSSIIKHIYTTDSIYHANCDKITVFNIEGKEEKC